MKGLFRVIALVTALICLLLPVHGLTEAQDISISVQWADSTGAQMYSTVALPMSEDPGETRYWLTVPPDISWDALTLLISDLSSRYVTFTPGTGEYLTGVLDAAIDPESFLTIMTFDAQGNPGPVITLYISTQEMPPEEGPVGPAAVTVHYVDDQGLPIAEDETVLVTESQQTIYAKGIDGYQLTGLDEYTIFLDANGASMDEVTFTYLRIPATAQVLVRYLDENYQPLLDEELLTLSEGEQTVVCKQIEGYAPAGPESYSVTVGASGASMSEITFLYRREAVSASVIVHFVDENDNPLINDMTYNLDEGEHVVSAMDIHLYTVIGPSESIVLVDKNGASPSELTFRYTRAIQPAPVLVYYIDDAGNRLAEDETIVLPAGENTVSARQFEGYELTTAESVKVTVDLEGAHPAEIMFGYTREVLPAPVTVHYVDQDGASIAPDTVTTVKPGWGTVRPTAEISVEDYRLTDPVSYEVFVSADGADPAEVTFVYQKAAKPVDIVVRYVNDLGEPIAPDQTKTLNPGLHTITPDAIIPEDEYALMEPEAYQIVVDLDGASMTQVVFKYQRLVRPVMITVHYQDERGETISPDTYQTYGEGEHLITPETKLPEKSFILEEPYSYPLTVTLEGGSLTEVTFRYRRVVQPAMVIVHYVDENGEPLMEDTAETFGEGTWAVFPRTEGLPPLYVFKGDPDTFVNVTVTADGADPSEITFEYEYRLPEAGLVTVRYVDAETGLDVAAARQVEVPFGQEIEVSAEPAPEDLLPNYMLAGQAKETVAMNENGQVSPDEVVFLYLYAPPVTEAPTEEPTPEPTEEPEPTQAPTEEITPDSTPGPVMVVVRYVNENDQDVALPQMVWCMPGYTQVLPQPEDLPEGYVLSGPERVLVLVDENGPNPAEAVFTYSQQRGDATAPKVALVTVKYISPDGEVFHSYTVSCTEGQDNPITVDMSVVDASLGYVLGSADTVFVTVDQNGLAKPDEVTFQFNREEDDYVIIRFLDAATGEAVASEKREQCFVGSNTIDARPDDLKEGYLLDSPSSANVTLDEDHVLDPAVVIFYYVFDAPATPEPTVPAFDTEMDEYFYPTGTEIRVRSGPTSAENNIVGLVNSTDVGHILGKVTARDGKGWYAVEINGLRGYINDGYVRILSWEEAAALFNFTPVPTEAPEETPTPAPDRSAGEATPVPQFEESVIDRWGITNKNVNFRTEASKNAKRIDELKRNTRLWIYSYEEVDGKIWYNIRVNGKDGYVMADYVDMFSEEESQEIQANLASPVPTQIPLPTAEPTEEPTPEPTEEPTEEPTPEPTEEPTEEPTLEPTEEPTEEPTPEPTEEPTAVPTEIPFLIITQEPTEEPTPEPTQEPTEEPTAEPTAEPTPEPTEEPTAEPTAEPTEEPTAEPTEEPTPEPTETPAPYRGYALTNGQATLRTGVDQTDDSILQVLPDKSLMYVSGQTYVDGVAWASAQAVGSGNLGFIQRSSLQYISAEEARPYLDQIQTTPVVTATPSPELVTGLAMTLGDGVPMRNFPDTNGEIILLLPYTAVADVYSQYYTDSAAWHLVQYNGMWGYIRQDQLRMMSDEEAAVYEEKMAGGTPTPTPAPTPEPVSEQSLSSYGHVTSNSGKVNLRSGPSKTTMPLRLLDNYAFALVLGSETTEEGTWYHISQAGTEGYILSDYFHVLSLGELSEFLQSSEYQNANSGAGTSEVTSQQIQPVEDYNNTVWQNPALAASYEPFNPFVTATPDPERLPTDSPAPIITPTATTEIAPVGPVDSNQPETTTREGGSAWPWVLIALAAIGGGGAYYGYTVHRQNEKRRQAARAQQARQARAAAAQPQMRQAQNNPAQGVNRASYPSQQSAAPFMPPKGGAPRPQQTAQSAQTQNYRQAQGNNPVRPAQQQLAQQAQPSSDGTQTFTPIRGRESGAAASTRPQWDIKRDPSATPMVRPRTTAENTVSSDDLAALAKDVKPAGENASGWSARPSSPLGLNIKVARPGLEELTPADQEIAAARKRIRRTERNKELYDQEDPTDQA